MTYTALHDLASRCLSVSTAGISPFHSIHLVTLNSSHFLKCAIPAPLPPLHMLFNAVLLLFAWLSSLTLHIAGKQSPREGFYIPPRRGNELPPQSPGRLFCLCHSTYHSSQNSCYLLRLQTQRGDQGHAELTH